MKPSRLEEFANRHFRFLVVGIFIVFCFFSYGIGHASAAKGQVYTIDAGHYDPVEMQQPVPLQENVWANGTYSNAKVNKEKVTFDIQDKLVVSSELTINPTSGSWMWYPVNQSGNRLTYTNTRGIVSYTDTDTILKEEITLYAPVSSIQWVLNLSMKPQALGFQVDPDGYSIRDPANTDQRIKIPFPYVVDSNGVRRNLTYGWNNGQRRLSLVQDFAGLQYPLVIDPIFVVDSTGITGVRAIMLVNLSNYPMIVYGDATNSYLKLAINNSGSITTTNIIKEGTFQTTGFPMGAVVDPTTDLPFVSLGVAGVQQNITYYTSGKPYTAIKEATASVSANTNDPNGVYAFSSNRIAIADYSGRGSPAYHFNISIVETTRTFYQFKIEPDQSTFAGSGGINTSNILNIISAPSSGAGVWNLTSVSDAIAPVINKIQLLSSPAINSTYPGHLYAANNPAHGFPAVVYSPANTGDAGTAYNGSAINYTYFTGTKWYHEQVYWNTTLGSIDKLPFLAYNSSGYAHVVWVERRGTFATTLIADNTLSRALLSIRIGANTWTTPKVIIADTYFVGAFNPTIAFDQSDGLHVAAWNQSSMDLIYYFEALPSSAAGAPPVASFTKNDTVLHLNEAINLSDTSSCTGCTNRQWNLTLETPADSYHKNESSLDWTISAWPRWGYYSIVKYLQNASGSDDATDHFTVINITPQAIFTCAPLSGTRPLTTTCTHANTGNWTKYNWTAGDGTNISALANPSFTYTVAGSYSVNETIWGDDLEYSIELKNNYITVTDPAPPTTPVPGVGNCTGSIALNISNGYPPLWVNLSYIGNNTVIDNITWMLGEGNTSTDWSPTAVYNWSATFEVSAYACNTTFNECCTATAKIWAWFFTCLQTGEDGNIPVALVYLLVPLTMGLSLFAVGSYDNRVYANIILGGFGSSIMWFYLATNVITANVFYLASDPGCVMMDTPLFWLFVLFGIIMTVYSVALVVEAIMERNVQDLGGEEE